MGQRQPDRGAYVPGAGDLHLYPPLPESVGAKQLLRTMGGGQKPVFLSEYGVGSLFDAVTALAEATCYTASADGAAARFPEAPDVAYIRSMAERFVSDWERFGMDGVYCFPEDALADAQLNQSLHRAVTFDLIRANGNIAGTTSPACWTTPSPGRAAGLSGAAGSPPPWTPWPQDGRRCAGAWMWLPP